MLRRVLIVMTFVVLALSAGALDFTLENISKIKMPLLHVVTIDSVMPTCDYVDHPVGAYGHSITNANKVPGRLVISMLGDTLYDSGEYDAGKQGMTIKITGNTSAYDNPKPYKIKLQKKADLLLRGDTAYCDKEWRLMREDMTFNTLTGLKVNELLGMQWTPRFMYCNVVINNEYQGLYLLVESVKRNRDARLNVSKTGFIVERDAYWWNEDVSFKSTFFSDGHYGWTFKEPDSDDVSPEQIDYIRQYICDAEAAIDAGNYPDYIDVESFASWLLAHDILGTWDSGGSNLYVTKYDDSDTTKLKMGCLWDFDSSGRVGSNNWSRYHNTNDFYFAKLLASSNDAFRRAYKAKWNQVKNTIENDIFSFLDEFANSSSTPDIYTSRLYHGTYHGVFFSSLSTSVKDQKAWFSSHLPWLGEQMKNISAVTDVVAPAQGDGKTYNLQGIEVPADTRGLVIRNHRLIKQ